MKAHILYVEDYPKQSRSITIVNNDERSWRQVLPTGRAWIAVKVSREEIIGRPMIAARRAENLLSRKIVAVLRRRELLVCTRVVGPRQGLSYRLCATPVD